MPDAADATIPEPPHRRRRFLARVAAAYLASPPLVALTTWFLYILQHRVVGRDTPTLTTRPYGIAYVVLVAALTALGGWGPGLLTLGLSAIALALILIPPVFYWEVQKSRDLTEMILLLGVGGLVMYTIESARRSRQRAGDLLRESEGARALQRAVMDASPVGVVTCDAAGVLNYANTEAERIWGKPLERVGREGWSGYKMVQPDGSPRTAEKTGLGRALAGEPGIIADEFIIERPDGSRSWVYARSTAIRDEQERILGAVSAFSDITARRAGEEAVRLSEERFRSLVEATAQIIWYTGADGTFVTPQPQWAAYTGQSFEEAKGQGWLEAVHPEDREETGRVWSSAVRSHLPFEIEHRLRRFDGEYHHFAVRAVPVMRPDGGVREWVGIHTDITGRKGTEAERARLLAEAEERAEHAALLNRIGQAQRGGADPAGVQAVAAEALAETLGAARCFFAWVDTGRGSLEILEHWRRPTLPSLAGTYRSTWFQPDLEGTFAGREPVVVADVHEDPRVAPHAAVFEELRVQSFIAVPLHEGERLTATLNVAEAAPRVWTVSEVSLAAAVAAQTHTAIELARLRQREHNIAERLQEALRPTLPEGVPGLDLAYHYRAALAEASVGGDFFDVFLLRENRVALVIGDLSGKGLEAAARIATVRNMLRYALYRGNAPAEALTELNDVLAENDLLEGFVTLFVALLDTGANTLMCVSCGHEPALLRRAATGAVEQVEATGPVLGAFPGATFGQTILPVSEGDALVLYTDGLSESGRARHEYLGAEGLAALAAEGAPGESASELARRIVTGADRYAAGTPHDDQCLLAAILTQADSP
jgi:PAS domain S-box-containing protein